MLLLIRHDLNLTDDSCSLPIGLSQSILSSSSCFLDASSHLYNHFCPSVSHSFVKNKRSYFLANKCQRWYTSIQSYNHSIDLRTHHWPYRLIKAKSTYEGSSICPPVRLLTGFDQLGALIISRAYFGWILRRDKIRNACRNLFSFLVDFLNLFFS